MEGSPTRIKKNKNKDLPVPLLELHLYSWLFYVFLNSVNSRNCVSFTLQYLFKKMIYLHVEPLSYFVVVVEDRLTHRRDNNLCVKLIFFTRNSKHNGPNFKQFENKIPKDLKY